MKFHPLLIQVMHLMIQALIIVTKQFEELIMLYLLELQVKLKVAN